MMRVFRYERVKHEQKSVPILKGNQAFGKLSLVRCTVHDPETFMDTVHFDIAKNRSGKS